MPMQGIRSLDTGILAFTNLTSLDVSRNDLVGLQQLPAKLQLLHAYENQVEDLSGPALPSLLHLGLGGNRLTEYSLRALPDRWPSLLSLDLSYNNLKDAWLIAGCCQQLKLRHLYLLGNPLVLKSYYRVLMVYANPNLRILDNHPVTESEFAVVPNLESAHWNEDEGDYRVALVLKSARRLPKVLAAHLAFGKSLHQTVQEAKKARGVSRDRAALYKSEVPAEAKEEEEAKEETEEEDPTGAKLEAHAEKSVQLCSRLMLEVQAPDKSWKSSSVFSAPGMDDELVPVEDAKVVVAFPFGDGVAARDWLAAGLSFRLRYEPQAEETSNPPTPKGSQKGSKAASDAGSSRPASVSGSKAGGAETIFAGGHVAVESALTPEPQDEVDLVLPGPPVLGRKVTARVVPAALARAPSVIAPRDVDKEIDDLLVDAGLGADPSKPSIYINCAMEMQLVLHEPVEVKEEVEAQEEE
jgi:hypothetical protein